MAIVNNVTVSINVQERTDRDKMVALIANQNIPVWVYEEEGEETYYGKSNKYYVCFTINKTCIQELK